jgi:hypothetical protein
LELELPHGHIEGLSVQLHGGKICSLKINKNLNKGNKPINSDLLLGVIFETNLLLHFIILHLVFLGLMSVI